MNTIKSLWLGWVTLGIAGGGAYYFAKQSINADRATRFEADQRRRKMQESLEYSSMTSSYAKKNGGQPAADQAGSPSSEASADPAPTRHAAESEGQRIREKSKYETTKPFISTKGDRFS